MGLKRNTFPQKNALEGKYANYFKVGHNAFEFVLDFGQFYAETNQAELYTRIITSPNHAKALLNLMHQALKQYETEFGSVDDD